MGLFGRSARAGDEAARAPRPIEIGDGDLDDAERLLDAVEQGFARATPTDASALWAALLQLSIRAGTRDEREVLRVPQAQLEAELGRTFAWLAAVAAHADARGGGVSTLALRIWVLAFELVNVIKRNMSPRLELELRIYRWPDKRTLDGIAAAAIVSARFMPDEYVVVQLGDEAVISAGAVCRQAAAHLGGALDAPLPPDVAATMETFGRYVFCGAKSGCTALDLDVRIGAPILRLEDPGQRAAAAGRCADALAAALAPAGGWAAYGAYRFVAVVLKSDFERPADRALLEAGLEFLRSNGVPWSFLSPFECREWDRLRGAGAPWIAAGPPPSPADAALRELDPGEERHVYDTLRADGHVNSIYAYRDDAGEHFALIAYDDPGEEPYREWQRAPTLYDLYVRLGEAAHVPQRAMSAEFAPFIPLPAPQIPLP